MPEVDANPICTEFHRQRYDHIRNDRVPERVTFSHEGFTAAVLELERFSMFTGSNSHYGGLPNEVDPAQTEPIIVHAE